MEIYLRLEFAQYTLLSFLQIAVPYHLFLTLPTSIPTPPTSNLWRYIVYNVQ